MPKNKFLSVMRDVRDNVSPRELSYARSHSSPLMTGQFIDAIKSEKYGGDSAVPNFTALIVGGASVLILMSIGGVLVHKLCKHK